MLKHLLGNYFVSATRSLTRHKLNLILTVMGLSIGLASAFLVSLYTINETSYDEFQPDAERTYRVVMRYLPTNFEHPLLTPRGYQHIKKIPGVEQVLNLIDGQFFMPRSIKVGTEYFKLNKVMAASENVTDFIAIEQLHGDLTIALTQPNKIAISQSEAIRLFGKNNAVGESFITTSSQSTIEVVAVFADLPTNSHYDMRAIISSKPFMESIGKFSHTYIKLASNTSDTQVAKEVTRILTDIWQVDSKDFEYFLQPLLDIHLAPNSKADMKIGGSDKTVQVSIALSILLLVISSFNYINMSVAQAGLRAKEVAIRKVLGASKVQLVIQFLGESVAIALISALFACGLVEVLLPAFNELVGRELNIGNWSQHLPAIIATTLLIGIVSGLYPALFISSFSIERVLSGDFGRGQSAIIVRKMLMILQSALSVGLIIGAISLYLQLNYLQNLNVNYSKEQRIKVLDLSSNAIYPTGNQTLYEELNKIDGVVSATPTDFDLTRATNAGAFVHSVPGVAEFNVEMGYAGVGFNAAQTLGLQLIAGRDFSPQYQTDWFNEEQQTIGIFISESVLPAAGYKTPEDAIGNTWRFGAGGQQNLQGKIIGVVKDVKIGSSKDSPSPVLFACGLAVGGDYSLVVEVEDHNSTRVKQQISTLLQQRLNVNVLDLQMVSENYKLLYQGEDQLVQMVSVFSGVAVFLTSVGMFGLAAFSAQQRKREVAIRKVLGASQLGLIALLTKESISLVLISLCIAYPASYYFVNNWLSNFNDRITQTPLVYMLATLLVAFITWATIATIAFRTASVNPELNLRND